MNPKNLSDMYWDAAASEDNIRDLWDLPKRNGLSKKEEDLYQEYWSDPFWDNSSQGWN